MSINKGEMIHEATCQFCNKDFEYSTFAGWYTPVVCPHCTKEQD